MFPNFRLMLVAMLASIVAIGCGLGLVAALRVNHQPFTRLANENPPLQLVFDHTIPAPQPAPFGVRFELGGPPIGSAGPPQPITAPAPPPAAVSPAPAPPESAVIKASKPAPDTAAPSDGKAAAEPPSVAAATTTAAITPATQAAPAPAAETSVKSAHKQIRRARWFTAPAYRRPRR